MELSNYLTQRGKRGIWQLRVPIPRALHRSGKPKERTKSLGTSDRLLATRRALPIIAQWQAEWLPGGPSYASPPERSAPRQPTIADLEEAAVAIGYELELERADEGRRLARGAGWLHKLVSEQDTRLLDEHATAVATGDTSLVQPLADEVADLEESPAPKGSPAYELLCELLNQAVLAARKVVVLRNAGDVEAESDSPLVRRVREREALAARPGETLLELYDAYAAWRGAPGRKRRRRIETFRHDRPAVELFAEMIGENRAVQSITQDDAREFRSLLATFPSSRSKNQVLAKASIGDCVELAKRNSLPLLSLTTQAKYLSILSPFFAWLVSDAPITIARNPFDGLHHKLERGENRRPSLTSQQLNQLLSSPLFSRCGGDGREHHVGPTAVRDWRYWIPLLCLFTGSRITEVAQLRVENVDIRDGVPLVLLTHDEENGQFVKSKRGRLAAIHPLLVEAGFLDYRQQQLDRANRDDNRQLFPELVAGKRALLGDAPARWFRRYLERIGIKDGADGFGAHSFRHTMADAMRAAGFLDTEFGQLILGHANNTITAAYGSTPQGTPARLAMMLEAALKAEPYSAVDFHPLRDTAKGEDQRLWPPGAADIS